MEIVEDWLVGRLHPGMSAGEYIASLGFRLTVAEAMAALPEGSNPQIAAVAGVDQSTVYRTRQRFADANPDGAPPARVIGADGKSYPGRSTLIVPRQGQAPDLRPRPVGPGATQAGRTDPNTPRPSAGRALTEGLTLPPGAPSAAPERPPPALRGRIGGRPRAGR